MATGLEPNVRAVQVLRVSARARERGRRPGRAAVPAPPGMSAPWVAEVTLLRDRLEARLPSRREIFLAHHMIGEHHVVLRLGLIR